MTRHDAPPPAFGLRPVLPSCLQALVGIDPDPPQWSPPPRLAHLHLPEFVASAWARLIAAVRQPAQVFDADGGRGVLVVGIAAVCRAPNGVLSVDVWRLHDGRLQWVRSAPPRVLLQAMPSGWVWLDLIRDAAQVELEQGLRARGLAFDAADLRLYARDLFAHFRRRLVRQADLRLMRRRVAEALALDANAVRIARRVIEVEVTGRAGRLSAYNVVVRHLQAFRLLERELPQAIPLYAAFVDRPDFPDRQQPAQALRDFLRRRGLGRRLWRLIVSAGSRLALPLRDFYAGDSGVAMLDYLRILNALRLRREPPGWLMWAILSRAGHPAQRYPILWDSLADAMPLFGHAARAVLAVHPEPVDELPLVLEWLALVRPELDKLQRRAGWPWLVAQARAWRDLRCLEIEAEAVSWSTPFVRMPVGTFEMVGLRSVRDLWDEARHMHHCADRFAGKCAAGFALVVSVRSGANPERRVATALYEQWAGQWELTQVRGVANRGATHEAEEAAAWFQRILNAPCPWPPEAELELGTRARVGEPRAGKAPRCMPPNARLVVAVTWSWSPMHSRRVRYQISGNRDRSLWLLWERCFDDNYGRWEPARLVAHVSRSDLGESAAAVQMLAACWRREIAEEGLDGFHEIAGRGIVTEDELERVAEALWPTQSP